MSQDIIVLSPEESELYAAMLKLHLQDGDIVFFDPHMIDMDKIAKIPDPQMRRVAFIPVHTGRRPLSECVKQLKKQDIQKILGLMGG